VREPMSEKLGRLPSVAFWIVITLSAAVLVICRFGSIIGLMVEPQNSTTVPMHLTTVLMSDFFWGVIVSIAVGHRGILPSRLHYFRARTHKSRRFDDSDHHPVGSRPP
jgi:hypothetical protein